ncbi:MAG: hypothetical protein ACYTGN_14715 [Planctomycetota bacterium]|jgi:hypothetical protein
MRILMITLALGAVAWAQCPSECDKAADKAADKTVKVEAKKAARAPLSARLTKMDEWCKNGCKVSDKILTVLQKETGAKTRNDMIVAIKKLEADKNTKTLLKYEQVAWTATPTSVKVWKYTDSAKNGCKTSRKVLKGLMDEFKIEQGKDCCTEKGPECDALIKAVKDVEMKAEKGDKVALARIDTLEAKIPSPFLKAKGAKVKDCGDCESCENCDDCENCDAEAKKDCEGKKQKDCDDCPSKTGTVG